MKEYRRTGDNVLFKFETENARDMFEQKLLARAVINDLMDAIIHAATKARQEAYKAWETVTEELGTEPGDILSYDYVAHAVVVPINVWEKAQNKPEEEEK